MAKEKLDKCFRCRSNNVGFIVASVNRSGGEVYKIKCEDCGLSSVEESNKDRLIRWWNDREEVKKK